MRLLFLTPQPPYPPQKGTALRNWGLISGLAERHEVAVLSCLAPGQPPDLDDVLTAACQVAPGLGCVRPALGRLAGAGAF
jgi:hypothetical protein